MAISGCSCLGICRRDFSCGAALSPELLAPRPFLHRDFDRVQPATDDVFKVYRSIYTYDRTPLDASVSPNPERSADWTKEAVTFTTAYGHERMRAFLFLPARIRPPYQVVLFSRARA